MVIFASQIMLNNYFFLTETVTQRNARSQNAKLIEIFTN